jgi:YVTN family beta-propeller protein
VRKNLLLFLPLFLLIFFLGSPILAHAATNNLYVANSKENTVSVANDSTNTTFDTINEPSIPTTVVADTARHLVYSTQALTNSIDVIDTTSNTIVKSIQVQGNPYRLALNHDGTILYAATSTPDSTVLVIDTATGTVENTLSGFYQPYGLAISSDNTRLYVSSDNAGTGVKVFDITNNYALITTIPENSETAGLALTPDGSKLYITNYGGGQFGNTVQVYNTTNDTLTKTIQVGDNPLEIVMSPDGTKAYVLNTFYWAGGNNGSPDATVSVIDTSTDSVIDTADVGLAHSGIAISPDGSKIYLTLNGTASSGDNRIEIMDTTTDSITGTITVGNEPVGIAVVPTTSLATAINAGGDTQGNYVSDTDFTGGSTYTSSASVDTSGVSNSAPQSVYQTVRYGNFSYTIPNLTANGTYTIRLHFNELYWGTSLAGGNGGVGSRVFNVAVNGTQALSNFDIYQTAGGSNKAVVEQIPATADANGNITIQFTTVTDNAMVNGIELYNGTLPSPTPTPTPTPVTSLAINTGGNASSNFVSDTDANGGSTYASTASVDTSGVTNPAPQSVYQTVRYGNFTYTIPTYAPSTSYHVRLHFNELYWGTPLSGNQGGNGSRVFNVSSNGTQELNNFDIYQTAGGSNKAVVEEFDTTTDSLGRINIQFSTVTDNAMVNGIEVSKN